MKKVKLQKIFNYDNFIFFFDLKYFSIIILKIEFFVLNNK
jgi:hypothetical protein